MNDRLKITVIGAVQGVGFRPFIYRLATQLGLKGYVLNSIPGVMIEVEGNKEKLNQFLLKIEQEKPVNAVVYSLEFSFLDPIGYQNFTIKESKQLKESSPIILPDIAVCPDCIQEMYDVHDRRYLYPFINCTNCGPRFSIIESMPYDRPGTSMKIFEMCDDCRREYQDPANRRFHAQPIACPKCGPQVELWDSGGKRVTIQYNAIEETTRRIQEGQIIAIKGLGGYQLLVDARNDKAVTNLRMRKHREEKPFALMLPSIDDIKRICIISNFEKRLLCSPESPIVLLRKRDSHSNISALSENIAPDNPYLGIMLPYTPIHHLLMNNLKIPIVATSGNLSEEPIAINESEALEKLGGITDFFLIHNRPIVRHVDDSIVRVIMGRELVLRRARGYAPLPIQFIPEDEKISEKYPKYLAVGAHLKNTVAVGDKNTAVISQHIGDLSTEESFNAFERVIEDLQKLYKIKPDTIITDFHPDYLSTKYAEGRDENILYVQHHEAHIAACRAENQITGAALGISWDGTGYGWDKLIWGGEFFISDEKAIEHVGQFRRFPLPGGELAIKEPRRSAVGALYEIFGNEIFRWNYLYQDTFSELDLPVLQKMLEKRLNCPLTSSVGRLFDAIASLLNICQKITYEGQAAMMLEYVADRESKQSYGFEIRENKLLNIDWQLIFNEILEDIKNNVSIGTISMKFHHTLAEIILNIAKYLGIVKVALSGGCFQNAILLESTITLLEQHGFRVYWHQRVPPNDGGISLGQIALARMQNKRQLSPGLIVKKEIKMIK